MNNSAYQRLDAISRVMFDPDACLELRPAASACGNCRTACPVSAFEWTDSGVSVSDRCMGCGQCANVCPTGALKVRGFAVETSAAPSGTAAIRIECARVPESIRGDALRVPCLGGVSAGHLIELRAGGHGRRIQLIDRGWCSECVAGRSGCSASRAVEEASAIVAALGCEESLWPTVEREDTPVAFAVALNDVEDAEPVGRRAFFGALVKRVASAAQAVPAEPVKAGSDARLTSPTLRHARQRFAENVRRLAGEVGARVPAAVFPQVTIAAGCDNSGICAAVCPSGALRRYDDDEGAVAGLEFAAGLCIACGVCVERCPSQALRMRPAGDIGEDLPEAPLKLTRFARRQCTRCGEAFVSTSGRSECGSCTKEHALFASLFPVFSRTAQRSAESDRH